MRLTARLRERSFSGRLSGRWTSSSSANVWLTEVDNQESCWRTVSHADDQGNFTLTGLRKDYFIRASIYVNPLYDPLAQRRSELVPHSII